MVLMMGQTASLGVATVDLRESWKTAYDTGAVDLNWDCEQRMQIRVRLFLLLEVFNGFCVCSLNFFIFHFFLNFSAFEIDFHTNFGWTQSDST